MLRVSVAVAIACMISGAALADCGVDHGSSAMLDDSSAKLNAAPVPKATVKQAATKKASPTKTAKPTRLACETQPCDGPQKPVASKRESLASAR